MVLTICLAGGMLGLARVDAAEALVETGEGANITTEKGKEGSAKAVALLGQATELASYARENESALAMLTAVQMLRRISFQEDAEHWGVRQTEVLDEVEDRQPVQKQQSHSPSLEADTLLAEATRWAQNDAHLLALIQAEQAKTPSPGSATLGATSGPIVQVDRVGARQTNLYRVQFRGKEVARVGVIGDGDTDLDLSIHDHNGNLIVRDIGPTDTCFVQWTPRRTGYFQVRVVNLGSVYNDYILMTN
jgi:hypothetical protein